VLDIRFRGFLQLAVQLGSDGSVFPAVDPHPVNQQLIACQSDTAELPLPVPELCVEGAAGANNSLFQSSIMRNTTQLSRAEQQ
jgi:hypothetical protein